MLEPPDTIVGVFVDGDTVGDDAGEPELPDPLVESLPVEAPDPLDELVPAWAPEEEVPPEVEEEAAPGSS